MGVEHSSSQLSPSHTYKHKNTQYLPQSTRLSLFKFEPGGTEPHCWTVLCRQEPCSLHRSNYCTVEYLQRTLFFDVTWLFLLSEGRPGFSTPLHLGWPCDLIGSQNVAEMALGRFHTADSIRQFHCYLLECYPETTTAWRIPGWDHKVRRPCCSAPMQLCEWAGERPGAAPSRPTETGEISAIVLCLRGQKEPW